MPRKKTPETTQDPALGQCYQIVCWSEGITRAQLSHDSKVPIHQISRFFNGKSIISTNNISKIREEINKSSHVKLKSDEDVIKYAAKVEAAGGINHDNIYHAVMVLATERRLSIKDVEARSEIKYKLGKSHFEKEYYMAKLLDKDSIKDLLEDPKVLEDRYAKKIKPIIKPKHEEGDELVIAVKKLIKAKGIKNPALADELGISHFTLDEYLKTGRFSSPVRSIIPQAMSKYGDYDTEEKIIRAADELEPMPKDMLKYRASIWKMKTIRGIRTDAINEKDHGVSHRCYEEATLPDSYISEAALRKFPAMFGCTSKTPMQELMEKAAVNDEDMQQFLHKGNNRKTRPTSAADDEEIDIFARKPVQRKEPAKKAVTPIHYQGR